MHACICAGNDAESETLQQNDVISISSTSSCEGIYVTVRGKMWVRGACGKFSGAEVKENRV